MYHLFTLALPYLMTTLHYPHLIRIVSETGCNIPPALPLDLSSELTLNWVTTKAGPPQRTGILEIDVSIVDSFRKRQGEFTDGFLGRARKASEVPIADNVVIKYVRLKPNDISSTRKKVTSALIEAEDTWSSWCHPRICPIWTITSCGEPIPAVAMPWFSNGNIIEYMRQNAGVDKLDIVKQVASAMAYIHSVEEVHGSVTPMNILVTDDGKICLSDVGLNTCLRNSIHDCSIPVPSSWMYKAPEELKAEGDFKPTQATDVYAFASTVYSIFASKPPLCSRPYGKGIKEIISGGLNLEKPIEVTGPLWKLLNQCWSVSPEDRPSMVAVEAALAGM